MSGPANGRQPASYQVVTAELIRQQFIREQLDAAEAGTGEKFNAALRTIWERLRTDPLNFGEPKYQLPALRLRVRQGSVHPIIVDYAVHEDQPVVFIRGFKVLT